MLQCSTRIKNPQLHRRIRDKNCKDNMWRGIGKVQKDKEYYRKKPDGCSKMEGNRSMLRHATGMLHMAQHIKDRYETKMTSGHTYKMLYVHHTVINSIVNISSGRPMRHIQLKVGDI